MEPHRHRFHLEGNFTADKSKSVGHNFQYAVCPQFRCLTRPYPGWKGRLRHFYCPLWQNALHRSGKAHCSAGSFCYSYCCFHVFGKSGSCSVYTCCRTLLKQGGGYPFPCCHSGFPDNPGSLTGYAQRHGVGPGDGCFLAGGVSWLRDIS